MENTVIILSDISKKKIKSMNNARDKNKLCKGWFIIILLCLTTKVIYLHIISGLHKKSINGSLIFDGPKFYGTKTLKHVHGTISSLLIHSNKISSCIQEPEFSTVPGPKI